jgi:hypothetical protein
MYMYACTFTVIEAMHCAKQKRVRARRCRPCHREGANEESSSLQFAALANARFHLNTAVHHAGQNGAVHMRSDPKVCRQGLQTKGQGWVKSHFPNFLNLNLQRWQMDGSDRE